MEKPKVGQKIRINYMEGEPQYCGCEGIVKFIDDMGGVHGTWGGLALYPEQGDLYTILEE